MKKFFVYAGVSLAIVLLLYFGISLWFVQATNAQVEARRKAIADAGDPIYLTDYETDEIPDEENAYHYLMLAARDLEAFETDWETMGDLELERRLRPDQVEALTVLVDKYEPLYERLEKAAECDQYRPDVDYEAGVAMLIPHVMHFRTAARALSAKALVAAYQDDGDEALQQCEISLRLGSNLTTEPALVSHLVNLACQGIAIQTSNHTLRVAATSPEMRKKLDATLATLDNRQATIDAMKGERAMGVQTFQQMRDGTLNPDDLGGSRVATFGGTWLGQAYLNDDEAKYIDVLDQQIEVVGLPKSQREKAMQPVWDELEQRRFRHLFTRLLAPALDVAVDVSDRRSASQRCLRVLLALVDADAEGIESAAEVDLPEVAKTDPFTGQPLLLMRLDGDWVVYSVSENLIDDGGSIHDQNGSPADEGLGPLLAPQELPDATVTEGD